MNIYGPGIIGRLVVVQPERIGEPGVGLGEEHDLTGTAMIESDFAAPLARQNLPYPAHRRQQFLHALDIGRMGYINMGQLVIATRERRARERIELLAEWA